MLLTCSHDEGLVVAVRRGVVEDHLRTVGVHALGRERVLEPYLGVQLRHRGADSLPWDSGLAQGTEHERLGEADERDGRRSAGRRKDGDERIAILRMRPGMQRRDGCLQVRGALAQREQRDADTRIVASEWARRCRGGGQETIVLVGPVALAQLPIDGNLGRCGAVKAIGSRASPADGAGPV